MQIPIRIVQIAVHQPVSDSDRRSRIEISVNPPAHRRLPLFFRHPVVKRKHFGLVSCTYSELQKTGAFGQFVQPDPRHGSRLHTTDGFLRHLPEQLHITGKILLCIQHVLKPIQLTDLRFDQSTVHVFVRLLRNVRSGLPKPSLLILTTDLDTFAGGNPNIERTAPVIPNRHTDLNNFRESDRIPEEKPTACQRIHAYSPQHLPLRFIQTHYRAVGHVSDFSDNPEFAGGNGWSASRCGHRGKKQGERLFHRFSPIFRTTFRFSAGRATVRRSGG